MNNALYFKPYYIVLHFYIQSYIGQLLKKNLTNIIKIIKNTQMTINRIISNTTYHKDFLLTKIYVNLIL